MPSIQILSKGLPSEALVLANNQLLKINKA